MQTSSNPEVGNNYCNTTHIFHSPLLSFSGPTDCYCYIATLLMSINSAMAMGIGQSRVLRDLENTPIVLHFT